METVIFICIIFNILFISTDIEIFKEALLFKQGVDTLSILLWVFQLIFIGAVISLFI